MTDVEIAACIQDCERLAFNLTQWRAPANRAELVAVLQHATRLLRQSMQPADSFGVIAVVAYAIYRDDGTLCEPIEPTAESADRCATIYAQNSGRSRSQYTIEPLVRRRDVRALNDALRDEQVAEWEADVQAHPPQHVTDFTT